MAAVVASAIATFPSAGLIPKLCAPKAGTTKSDTGSTVTPTHHERIRISALTKIRPIALLWIEAAALIGQSSGRSITEASLSASSMQASQGSRRASGAMGEAKQCRLLGFLRPRPTTFVLLLGQQVITRAYGDLQRRR